MTNNALPNACGNREAQPLHILLMDDHAIVRRGIKQLIAEEFPNAVFGEAQNLVAGMQQLENPAWTIMIFDISLPDGNGLDLLKKLASAIPKRGY